MELLLRDWRGDGARVELRYDGATGLYVVVVAGVVYGRYETYGAAYVAHRQAVRWQ